jgi:hypothetical protein
VINQSPERQPLEDSALSALHAAAEAIRKSSGVTTATAENDHKSGEIIFTLNNGHIYALRLVRLEDDA